SVSYRPDVREMRRRLRPGIAVLSRLRSWTRREHGRTLVRIRGEARVRDAHPANAETLHDFDRALRDRHFLRDRCHRGWFYLFRTDPSRLAGGANLADGVDAGLDHRNARGGTAEEFRARGARQLDLLAAECGGGFDAALQPLIPAAGEKKIHKAVHLF